ncbi:hypothetical protein GCM10011369_23410 [Neiella marina]|uniref:Uncharacterized protein n=1 Tax=Neiella marina TaxID=508461 RepID=A0A8J2XPK3_9GAMM|nr:phage tail protein [Neiella marina]GGA80771.1 hypothetical protein GCM10011369_23410 [Neiella marina]
MARINLNYNEIAKGMAKLNQDFKKQGKAGDKAVQNVLNRGLTSVRKSAVKQAATEIGIPQKPLKRRFKWRRAKPGNLQVTITARTRGINAINAGAKPTETGYAKGPYEWQGAFRVNSRYGVPIAVQRYGKKRYPLKPAEIGSKFVYREVQRGLDTAASHFQRVVYSREMAKEIRKQHRKLLDK